MNFTKPKCKYYNAGPEMNCPVIKELDKIRAEKDSDESTPSERFFICATICNDGYREAAAIGDQLAIRKLLLLERER